jgi:hypothetical protein
MTTHALLRAKTELILRIGNPLLIAAIHFKYPADGSLCGILQLRNDGVVEWYCLAGSGIESKLEPHAQLKYLDRYFDFYIAESDRIWHQLEVHKDWTYSADSVTIPTTPTLIVQS